MVKGSRPETGGRTPDGSMPNGAPADARRPSATRGDGVPGKGKNRPSPSLVSNPNESTEVRPDLKYRMDDIGRGFLYAPPAQGEPPVPPVNEGVRSTTHLSARAVRQIKGAAIKAEQMGYGLKTFMTFTVREEERAAFLAAEFILGREMRRVLNALNEWFRRRGHPLMVYVWVAENVKNSNPHVHLLTNHTVPRTEFSAFCQHVESLWRHGWVHVERVKNSSRAGSYMMKALKYTLKGQEQSARFCEDSSESDQGLVHGNRYGVSRAILPKYETVELYDCGDMAYGVRNMQKLFGGDIEEYAPGVWLTRYGLAFEKGTDLVKMQGVLDDLHEHWAEEYAQNAAMKGDEAR